MKRIVTLALAVFCLIGLFGCSSSLSSPGGREYVYEREGYGGSFVITLKEDGTFVYVEGWLGSYTGVGQWTMEDSIVTLADDRIMGQNKVNRFRFDGRNLVFLQKESSNFTYLTVKDGERFIGQESRIAK